MAEQRIDEEGFGFKGNGELNLGFKRGFERLVGIVRDIVERYVMGLKGLGIAERERGRGTIAIKYIDQQ